MSPSGRLPPPLPPPTINPAIAQMDPVIVMAAFYVIIMAYQRRRNQQNQPHQLTISPNALHGFIDDLNRIEREQRQRKKRTYHEYKREIAAEMVKVDYFTLENPTFDDKAFQRCFRITKSHAQYLVQLCGASDRFFQPSKDAIGRDSICPKAKVLIALQVIAYGISASGFQNYYRMGEGTARKCYQRFVYIIAKHRSLKAKYLRSISDIDAQRLHHLHLKHHGIPGMIGSIDCMHIG